MSQVNRKKKIAATSSGNQKTRDRYLRDPRHFAPGFQRLARAVAEVSTATLSHEECQLLLEFYVDSEQRGENARAFYPKVFKHLKTCPDCRMTYDTLTDAISPAASHDLDLQSESRIELPFLARSTPDAAWSKHVRSPIGGALLGFVFKINPSHLARVIAQPPQFAMRGQSESERSLLLLDSVALGSRDVQVAMWLHRAENPDYARLEISVVSSTPLPEPLRVNLRCNNHPYPASIEQGTGWIDQITISELENAQISVEFEAGQPSILTES